MQGFNPSMGGISPSFDSRHMFGGNIANNARLFIFTPIRHGSQALRPYVYNFNQSTVDAFINNNGAMDALHTVNRFDKDMCSVITPSMNSISLDTSMLDNYYSFILVVDAVEPVRSMIAFGGPKHRTVLSGYFIGDEPISAMTLWMANPSLNHDALMIFTHNNSVALNFGNQFKGGFNGSTDNISILAAMDIVPQALDSMVSGHDLSLCDLGSIASSFTPDGYSPRSIPTGKPLALAGFNGLSPAIDDRIKSPKHQLIDLTNGISQAVSMSSSDYKVFGSMEGSLIGNNPQDTFTDHIYAHLQRPDASMVHQGINPANFLTLGQLCAMFPNIEVQPCAVPYDPQHDLRDQTDINIHTVFSSLVSHSVAAMASTSLLGTIMFRYCSWARNSLEARSGAWQILGQPSLMLGDEVADQMLEKSVNGFIKSMESNLFPILQNAGGAFDLLVNYNSTGTTDVDLHFMDFSSDGRGYFTIHNRLGGIISPAVGSKADAMHNKQSFESLVNELVHSGIVQSNDNEHIQGY
jgi:hypothetical protein